MIIKYILILCYVLFNSNFYIYSVEAKNEMFEEQNNISYSPDGYFDLECSFDNNSNISNIHQNTELSIEFKNINEIVAGINVSFEETRGDIYFEPSREGDIQIISDTFSLTTHFKPISSGNSILTIYVKPILCENNNYFYADEEFFKTVNLYITKEIWSYSFSTISNTTARIYSANHLITLGLLKQEDYDEYIYEESQYTFANSVIPNTDCDSLETYFYLENMGEEFFPGERLITKLIAYDNDNNTVGVVESQVEENGKININFNFQNFTKIFLYIYAKTNLANFINYNTNVTYAYELDLSNIITYDNVFSKYYLESICTDYDSDRGKAFLYSKIINTANDFLINNLNYNPELVTIKFPGDKSCYTHNTNTITINLVENSDMTFVLLHEYGHFVCEQFEIKPEKSGGQHYETEDLYLRYLENDDDKKKGYGTSWSEGFATFFAIAIQSSYDNSDIFYNWFNKYNTIKSINVNNANFVLRESNERTVTLILLALSDPTYLYEDAIGFEAIFGHFIDYKKQINSLSVALSILQNNYNVNKELISQCLSYYKIAPHNGNIDNNQIVYEEEAPTFEWNKGNYVFYEKYYKYDSEGKKYTAEDELIDPSVAVTNVGACNDNFVFNIVDSSGTVLLSKNIVSSVNSEEIVSYTPTVDEWKTIFYSSSFVCYWYVEGWCSSNPYYSDSNGYKYTSESYSFILEKKYEEIDTQTDYENYDIDNLELTVELSQTLPTNDVLKRYEINVNYVWDENNLPEVRLKDYIVLQWNYIYNLNGTFYSVNYYDDDTIYTSDSSYSGQIFNYGSTYRELYYEADLMYNKKDEPVSKLYGEAKIGIETSQNYSSLFVSVTYYHILNTATAMEGIQQNNYGYYVNTSEIEKIAVTYEF